MRGLRRIGYALFLLAIFVVPVRAQGPVSSPWTISNGVATYTFTWGASEVELIQGSIDGTGWSLPFRGRTSWEIEFRDQGQYSPSSAPRVRVTPSGAETLTDPKAPSDMVFELLEASSFVLPTGSGIFFRWCVKAAFPDLPPGGTERIEVVVRWDLHTGEDFLRGRIWELDFGPSSTDWNADPGSLSTAYRPWSIRFPVLKLERLSDEREDVLAVGRYGGRLYRDPIDYRDNLDVMGGGEGNRLEFFDSDSPTINLIGLPNDNFDPGKWAVPLTCYYDSASGRGYYLANNDDQGYSKSTEIRGVGVKAPEEGEHCLQYEVLQMVADPIFANGSIFEARKYRSPFSVLVGVFAGDWVDAAKKYRSYRRDNTDGRFPWLDGSAGLPAGHSGNTTIPLHLKDNPIVAKLTSEVVDFEEILCPELFSIGDLGVAGGGTANCPAASEKTVARDLLLMNSKVGVAGMLLLERFWINLADARATSGSLFEPNVASAHWLQTKNFVDDAKALGHSVYLGSLTEKFFYTHIEKRNVDCDDCAMFNICDVIDPAYKRLMFNNAIMGRPANKGGGVCPLGNGQIIEDFVGADECALVPPPLPAGTPVTSRAWLAEFAAEVIDELGVDGGLRLNIPGPFPFPCFENHPDPANPANGHPPGFGSALFQAWVRDSGILQEMEVQAGRDLVFTMGEGMSAAASKEVQVLNCWQVDLSADVENSGDSVDPLAFFENRPSSSFPSPICKIPMVQMILDEVVYNSTYPVRTMELLNTSAGTSPPIEVAGLTFPSDYFDAFPAVSGALQCWNMAKRVLGYQGGILLTNAGINHDVIGTTTPEARAIADTYAFYRKLAEFLTATTPIGSFSNMKFHKGTMERSPRQFSLGVPETFIIESGVVSAYFPKLHDVMTIPGLLHPDGALDFGTYRSLDQEIFYGFDHNAFSSPIRPIAPDERESWLPHGMYRHAEDSSSLGFFVANPWGVDHQFVVASGAGLKKKRRPMNPFTFPYGNPDSAPTENTYGYTFVFEPADYGFTGQYRIVECRFDGGSLDGPATTSFVSGPATLSGTLAKNRVAAYYFTDI